MNQALFSFFYNFAHQSAALDAVIVFLAKDFVWVILVAVFFYLLKNKDKHVAIRDIIIVFGAAAVGVVVASVLKNLFHTVRPLVQLPDIQSLLFESDSAFPSGHTTLLVTIAAALWRDYRRPAILVGLGGILVGLARVAAGVHWPIDIAGGILLGCAIGISVYKLAYRVLPKVEKSLY